MIPRHPDPTIRRSVRVLRMVHELHKLGYQRVRVFPAMSPSGMHWRCTIGPATLFLRRNGAICTYHGLDDLVALYGSGEGNRYFSWSDAATDDAATLASKFIDRFPRVVTEGRGFDFAYAGWFTFLIGLAEQGFIPYAMSDFDEPTPESGVALMNVRPADWGPDSAAAPVLPLPPPGEGER